MVVSLGGEAEAGGSWKVEVGCQEEEVEMGARRMMHWAEEVLVGERKEKLKILFLKKKKKKENKER